MSESSELFLGLEIMSPSKALNYHSNLRKGLCLTVGIDDFFMSNFTRT